MHGAKLISYPSLALSVCVFSLWLYHVNTRHLDRRCVCARCQCTFVTKRGLNSHVRRIHEKLCRYTCELCGKGYSDGSNYRDHIATHAGVKRNVCSICQKQFTSKNGLRAHMLYFHTNTDARSFVLVWDHAFNLFYLPKFIGTSVYLTFLSQSVDSPIGSTVVSH